MNNKNQKLLSICIPTYNRREYLDKCLGSILPQVGNNGDLIEVIISDNASTDGSELLICEYAKKYNFKYTRNNENIGGALNVISCYENATGKYAWIFSDDDYLFDGALEKIIKLLNKSPQIVFLNNVWYNQPLKPEETTIKSDLEYTEFVDGLCYIERVTFWVTFLTSNIVQKQGLHSIMDPSRFNNTFLPQLGWILPVSFSNELKIVVERPTIACKSNNSGGYKIAKVFGESFNKIIDQFIESGFNKEYKNTINRNLLRYFFPHFVKTENWTLEDSVSMFFVFWPYREYWSIYVFAKARPYYAKIRRFLK